MMILLPDLANAVSEAGLKFRNCGRGHYQVIGGNKLVNFYVTTKGSKIYVEGERKGRFVNSVKQVIEATGCNPTPKDTSPTISALQILEQNKELRTDIKTLCDWIRMSASGITPPNERTVKVGDVVNKYSGRDVRNGLELRHNERGTLEIVQRERTTYFVVAYWNQHNLTFVGIRPLEVDQDAFWKLVKQGYGV